MPRQQRVQVARQFERGEHVGLEDAAPFVLAVVGGRPADIVAGVVDQDVQPLAEVLDPVEQFAPLLLIGDIGGEHLHLALGKVLLQLRARGVQAGRVARGQQHVGAEAEQFAGDGAADAGAAAGDQRQVSVQPPASWVHAVSSCRAPRVPACTRPGVA